MCESVCVYVCRYVSTCVYVCICAFVHDICVCSRVREYVHICAGTRGMNTSKVHLCDMIHLYVLHT